MSIIMNDVVDEAFSSAGAAVAKQRQLICVARALHALPDDFEPLEKFQVRCVERHSGGGPSHGHR